MPELPEVERVRLSLMKGVIGRRVVEVKVRRSEVIVYAGRKSKLPTALLQGATVTNILRHGKQLALVAGDGAETEEERRAICVHLGMTGSLVVRRRGDDGCYAASGEKHAHLEWTLDDGARLTFRDPRRFGGVWTFPTLEALRDQRWSQLGPDALMITADDLHAALRRTNRSLKAALLDQTVIAGLGNIYVDELLFALRLHPRTIARKLKAAQVDELIPAMTALLSRAIAGGGSSLRDYVDGEGNAGSFQHEHRVYGRGGLACLTCESTLRSIPIAGRTTVFCPVCQRGFRSRQAAMRRRDI